MTRSNILKVSLIFALFSIIPFLNSYAGNIESGSWTADQVSLVLKDVPVGKKVIVCVFIDQGCEIRASVVSAAAGSDGKVAVIVPKKDTDFAIGDQIRVNDPACAQLAAEGAIEVIDCAEVCRSCNIPSLTQYGLIALLIILASIATWVVLRRRRVVTA